MLGLDRGADGDVADLDVVWLFDGEGDRARDRLRWDGELVHAALYLLAHVGSSMASASSVRT